jgi:UDP-2,3-diacylglucosamine pyrophosphatase LpxH
VHEVRRRELDGVICGHIHRPELETMDGVLYCNDGDWVEHCTVLVEDRGGELELWDWSETARAALEVSAPLPLRAAA